MPKPIVTGKLANNSGWVKEYKLKGDRLYSSLDIQDDTVAEKLPKTIRWTSPWINSFTDGNGQEWKNVISHLALTTRPRIVEQEPFGSIAAALSHSTPARLKENKNGLYLSNAGLLNDDHTPSYPMAFSIWSGVRLSDDWVSETGPRGGKKWRNKKTGKVVYSKTRPGGSKSSSPQTGQEAVAQQLGQKPKRKQGSKDKFAEYDKPEFKLGEGAKSLRDQARKYPYYAKDRKEKMKGAIDTLRKNRRGAKGIVTGKLVF